MRLSFMDDRGNFAVMAALILPVILLLTLSVISLIFLYTQHHKLEVVARTACMRAVKPLRMKIYTDAERQLYGEQAFDEIARENGLEIKERAVTAGWLTATITASMDVESFGGLGINRSYEMAVAETCKGVPPYPAVGDVILSSHFSKPTGDDLPMPFISADLGDWGVFDPRDFGWDGGDGPGIEIQDWIYRQDELPPGITARYIVELDSHANSSMYKELELHRGTYRFSFWYWGRTDNAETNGITAYIQGIRPASRKKAIIEVAEDMAAGWLYKYYDINVPEYSLYRFELAATGTSDSYGGIFNDLRLTYLKRPDPEYND